MKIFILLFIMVTFLFNVGLVTSSAEYSLPYNSSEVIDTETLSQADNIGSSDNLLLSQVVESQLQIEEEDPEYIEEAEGTEIADPLEPVNRAAFYFNDKLYFWVLKPLAKGYSAVVPEDARIAVRNAFNNIAVPIRVVNNLLQFKVKSAGNEVVRFCVNSTLGLLGLFDVAKDKLDIKMQDEDFGQTLGVWGLGPGIFITWPVLGPSSLRDSVGFAGDYYLDPVSYVNPVLDSIAIRAGDRVNRTSLVLGQYEDIKKDAIDPYAAFRDIYHQYRENKIKK